MALKVVKSAEHYTEAAEDEIKILQHLTDHDPDNTSRVMHLLDSFKKTGPNGTRKHNA